MYTVVRKIIYKYNDSPLVSIKSLSVIEYINARSSGGTFSSKHNRLEIIVWNKYEKKVLCNLIEVRSLADVNIS